MERAEVGMGRGRTGLGRTTSGGKTIGMTTRTIGNRKNQGEKEADMGREALLDGRRNDRRNEMVARGFARNTKWKNIKATVEEVMNKSGVVYDRVQVIGGMNQFACVRQARNIRAQTSIKTLAGAVWRRRRGEKGPLVWGHCKKRCEREGAGGR